MDDSAKYLIINIDGTESISIRYKTKVEGEGKEKEEKVEILNFTLLPISAKEIGLLRKDISKAYLILKKGNSLYFTEIPMEMRLFSQPLYSHQCNTCSRLSALPDCQGGCAKTRNSARFIERYDFITNGIETINLLDTSLIVNECCNFQKIVPRKIEKLPKEKRVREISFCGL